MTATIEPRLIHLLNESTTPQISSADLPPLSQLPYPKSSDLPLPPIDSDPIYRSERNGSDSLSLINSSAPFANDDFLQNTLRDDFIRNGASASRSYPVHSVLSDSDPIEPPPPSSLSKILDDTPGNTAEDLTNKKRARVLNSKDDFMQLPQPVKKQKAAPQTHVMPPIINGLHEPPPHAALFPPMASSSSFQESDPSQRNYLQDLGYVVEERTRPLPAQPAAEEPEKNDKSTGKAPKRATKPRSKWSEEETKHLLLGVSKYGVGKWKNILGDPQYRFNDRSAGDLKDRFRTCCPDELRNSKKTAPPATKLTETLVPKKGQRKGRDLDKILINVDEVEPELTGLTAAETGPSVAPPKKSRAHRKKMKDLAELGIVAPFRPSGRRERRPFTDEEDKQILDGLEEYGPAWTKIQRDPRFNLSKRQPTDLRDRVRNGYPNIYQRIERGTFQAKSAGRSNDIMEPSVTTSIGNRLERPAAADHLQATRNLSREEAPRWPIQILDTTDTPLSPQHLEFGDTSGQSIMGGEMDISRLLLDEPALN
ncbi:hypothetical protein NLU13_0415 [Sarocladium strictum]|uniref:Uncharacterized protein n=1 Tax=Sarocladium strictum TaxID=5046 RepID=A0AA39GRS5_SARSR|nr:hypothetical protein NLU13_0415 [Sarocladium strictum]